MVDIRWQDVVCSACHQKGNNGGREYHMLLYINRKLRRGAGWGIVTDGATSRALPRTLRRAAALSAGKGPSHLR